MSRPNEAPPSPRRAALTMPAPARAPLSASVLDRPFSQTAPRRVEVLEGASLAMIVEAAIADPVLRFHAVVDVNGVRIPAQEWADTFPPASAVISIAIRPAGGGDDGNKILRTILQIAVIAVATWVGGGAGGAIAAEWLATAAAASVVVVGNLAINALVPPPQPRFGAGDRAPASYRIEGARNELNRFGVFKIPFGRTRFFPPFWGLPIQETVGDDVYLRFLLALGPNGFDYSNVRIGETPIEEFDGVEIEVKKDASDPDLTLYRNDPHTLAIGATLDQSFTTRTTQTGTTELVAVLDFPIGLGAKNDKGRNVARSVSVELEYRLAGSADPWQSARPTAPGANAAVAVPGSNRRDYLNAYTLAEFVDDLPGGTAAGAVTYTRSEPGRPFRRDLRVAVPEGQYEVRLRRASAESTDDRVTDRVAWSQLISIAPRNPTPIAEAAAMAVRIKASDQLSGVVDTLNLDIERHAPSLDPLIGEAEDPDFSEVSASDWTAARATRNPADLALWSVRGPHVANPKADDEIDWSSAAVFWRWCYDQGFTFDFVLESDLTRRNLLDLICAAGRARAVKVNGKLSFVIDAARDAGPVQMFTARNVRNFRVIKTFPGEVHGLRVEFLNEDKDYRLDERIVYADGFSADGAGETQVATKLERIEFPGVTNADLVYQLARFHWATAILQTERYIFDVDVERLVANYGALVAVQHDVMVLGLGSARVSALTVDEQSGDILGVEIDDVFEMEAGKSYGVRWRRVSESAGAASIETIESVGVDLEVGAVSALTFATPRDPADAPAIGELIAFGEFEQETVNAIVRGLRPADDLGAQLECVWEAPARYSAAEGAIPSFTSGITTPIRRRPPAPELVSTSVRDDGIFVSFSIPAGLEERLAQIEASSRLTPGAGADGVFSPLAPLSPSARVVALPPGLPGELYDVSIVLVDQDGARSTPLLVEEIAADETLSAPANVAAVASVRASANGVREPIVTVSADPNEDFSVEVLIVETRPAGGVEDDFEPALIVPAENPSAVLSGLAPGASLDFAFSFRSRRGLVSARSLVLGVDIPDELVAGDTVNLGGRDVSAVLDDLDGAVEEAGDAWGEFEAYLDAHSDLVGPDGVLVSIQDQVIAADQALDDLSEAVDQTADQARRELAQVAGRVETRLSHAWGLIGAETASREAAIEEVSEYLSARLGAAEAGINRTDRVVADLDRSIARTTQQIFAALGVFAALASTEIEARASETEAVAARTDRLLAETAVSIAGIEETALVYADLDGAFSGFGLDLESTFNIEVRFGDVEDELDENVSGSLAELVASIALDYVTSTDQDAAFSAFGLDLGSAYNIENRFGDVEDELDEGVSGSVAANAALALDTLATQERATARLAQTLSAQMAATLARLDAERIATASETEAAVRRTDRLLAETAVSIAGIEETALVYADLDGAFSGFGLDLESTFNIEVRFGDVEDELDENVSGSLAELVASIALDYVTSTDQDAAFSAFGLDLGSAYNIENRFGDVEDELDEGVSGSVAANAALALDTLATQERATARLAQTLSAQMAATLARLDAERIATASETEAAVRRTDRLLAETAVSIAGIEETALVYADLDGAFSGFGLDLESTFNIEVRFGDVEDELDENVSGSLAELVASIALDYVTQADIDNAISAIDLSAYTEFTTLQGTVGDHEQDLDGETGVSPGLNAISSLLLTAFIDASDPDNPELLARASLVAEAAGGDPAYLTLLSGDGLSSAILVGDEITLGNLGAGEDEIVPILAGIGGYAFFAEPIHIDDAAGTPTARVIVGPLADGIAFWLGDPAEDESTADLANAKLALTEDGLILPSEASTTTSGTSIASGDWRVVGVHSLSETIEVLNEFSFAGTSIAYDDPSGASNGQTLFDWALIAGNGSAPSIGDIEDAATAYQVILSSRRLAFEVNDAGSIVLDDGVLVRVFKEAGLSPEVQNGDVVEREIVAAGPKILRAGATWVAVVMRERSGVGNTLITDGSTIRVNKIRNHDIPA